MNPPYHHQLKSTCCQSDKLVFCVSNELRLGKQAAAELLHLIRLRKNSSNANADSLHPAFDLLMKIIHSFSNSLSMLSSQDPLIARGLTTSGKSSKTLSLSGGGGGKMCHKPSCRKGDSWTQVTSDLSTDGYAWRKYGQKPILNAKHPRSYYKCTNKPYCQALKRVQKMDDDEPQMYKITHTGHHTCENHSSSTSFSDMDSSIIFNFDKENNEQSVKFSTDQDVRLASVSSSVIRVKGSEECKNQQYYSSGLNPNNQTSIVEEMESSRNVLQWSLDEYDYLIGSVEFSDLHT